MPPGGTGLWYCSHPHLWGQMIIKFHGGHILAYLLLLPCPASLHFLLISPESTSLCITCARILVSGSAFNKSNVRHTGGGGSPINAAASFRMRVANMTSHVTRGISFLSDIMIWEKQVKTTHLKTIVQKMARRNRKYSKDLVVQLIIIQDLTVTVWQPFIMQKKCFEGTSNEIWNTGV